MCEKSLKKVDHTNCKIRAFKVKRRVYFTPCRIGSTNFASFWLKTFALHKVETIDVTLGN
jgi:hypothetical protein